MGPDPATPRQPLAGVRVLDCGTVYAAPITAMLLGDFGADVIKVEHPAATRPAPTAGTSTGTACGGRLSPATSGASPSTSASRRARTSCAGSCATPTC